MSKRSIVLAVGVIAAIASLIVGSAASAKGEATAAGTVVFVHDQEPGILNLWLSTGNGYVNSITTGPVLATGAVYNDKAKLVPFLMESVPKVVKAEPLTDVEDNELEAARAALDAVENKIRLAHGQTPDTAVTKAIVNLVCSPVTVKRVELRTNWALITSHSWNPCGTPGIKP